MVLPHTVSKLRVRNATVHTRASGAKVLRTQTIKLRRQQAEHKYVWFTPQRVRPHDAVNVDSSPH